MLYTEYKSLIKKIGLDSERCGITITGSMQYYYYGDKFICDDFCNIDDLDLSKVKEIALTSKI